MYKFARIFSSIFTLFVIALLLACAAGKKKPSEYAPGGLVAPTDLKVEANSHSMDLSWKTNRTEDMIIAGYNIYISTQPLTQPEIPNRIKPGIEPFNQTIYPGDEDPQISYESYTATGLENGVPYYVAVTTVYPDKFESGPSNVVMATCYPRGTVTINDRSMGPPDGFSFAQGNSVPYNSLDNDLYFISRDVGNMLGSPDRNDGVLKHTEFAEIPGGATLNDRHDYTNLAFKDRTFVAEGNIYMVKLANGTLAKIRVRQVDSSAFKKQVIFDYIYFD